MYHGWHAPDMQGGSLRALLAVLLLLGTLVPLAEAAHNNQPPPVADFSWSPESPVAGQDVHFLDQSYRVGGKPIWRAVWTSDAWPVPRVRGYAANYTGPREVTLNFSQAGAFDVTLTVYDHGGHSDSKTKTVTVRPAPTVAVEMAQEGPSVSVKAQASSPYASIKNFTWVWGDGTPNGTTAAASHRYATPGNFTLRVLVFDELGNPGRAQVAVSLPDEAPAAAIRMVDPVPLLGATVLFRDDSRASAFSPIASRAWLVDDAEVGADVGLAHVFDAAGWHNVTLRVVDERGREGEATLPVLVLAPPVAAFAASVEERAVAVDAGDSADPEGGALAFSWDWGDGSPREEGVTARHEYVASGAYAVNLTVSDPDGLVSFVVREVVVAGGGVVAAFDASPASAKVGQTVRFVDASVDPDGPVSAWAWELGDGATATGVSVQHVYATGGRFVVNLTVTGSKGDLARVSHVVTVESPPPVVVTRPTPATPPASPVVDPTAPPTGDEPVEPASDGGTTPTPPPASPTQGAGGKPSPAPGLAALLLALGAAVVLLTRRR